jgi:hypothetical protein
VNGDDEESSNYEDIDVPTLVEEAVIAGFTIDQLRQAKEELSSPVLDSPEVSAKLQEGSVSKQIVQLWIANRQSKAKPWCGPLPSPGKSPLRTLGDAMANAKFTPKKRIPTPCAIQDRYRDAALCWGSSTHDRIHKKMVTVMGIIGATLILRRVQMVGDLSRRHRVK